MMTVLDGRTFREETRCYVCRRDWPEQYMVTSEVWRAATRGLDTTRAAREAKGVRGVYLCLSCLESRVGRPIVLGDFVEAPINDGIRWAWARS